MSNTSRSNTTARFTVTAVPDPSVMPRVLELFAKRNLIPDRFAGCMVHDAEPHLEIIAEMAGLNEHLVGYLGRCMEQITYVLSVQVCDSTGQQKPT